ncbi:hypothetical protein PG988_010925 [Apiospora saccharicola]
MLASLALLVALVALVAVLEHYLGDFYLVLAIMSRRALPGPDFPERMESSMRGTGIAVVLSTVGIWAIKLNFLTFFRRFGAQVRAYMVAWWVACLLVVASAVAQIGMVPCGCLFTSCTSFLAKCETDASLLRIYGAYKATVALDVVSDVVNAYKSINDFDRKVINTAWMLFWFMIQYFNRNKKRDELARRRRAAWGSNSPAAVVANRPRRGRWSRLQDSVLQTLADPEAKDLEPDCGQLLKHEPPSGTFAVEFSNWYATDTYKGSFSHHETLYSSHSTNSSSLYLLYQFISY